LLDLWHIPLLQSYVLRIWCTPVYTHYTALHCIMCRQSTHVHIMSACTVTCTRNTCSHIERTKIFTFTIEWFIHELQYYWHMQVSSVPSILDNAFAILFSVWKDAKIHTWKSHHCRFCKNWIGCFPVSWMFLSYKYWYSIFQHQTMPILLTVYLILLTVYLPPDIIYIHTHRNIYVLNT